MSPVAPKSGDIVSQDCKVLPISNAMEDEIEKAFWEFDSRRKKESERDVFKYVVRRLLRMSIVLVLLFTTSLSFAGVASHGELIYTLVNSSYETGAYGNDNCSVARSECRDITNSNKVINSDYISNLCAKACTDGRNKVNRKNIMDITKAYIDKTYGTSAFKVEKLME